MFDIHSLISTARDMAISQQSGSLHFMSGSVEVSASVYASYVRQHNREMKAAGYQESFDEAYVIAKPSDVENWGLMEQNSQVTLNGVAFVLGQTINKADDYWTIWLRLKT